MSKESIGAPLTKKAMRETRRAVADRRKQALASLRQMMSGPLGNIMRAAGLWSALTSYNLTERGDGSLDDLHGRPTAELGRPLPSYETMRADLERLLGREQLREMIPVNAADMNERWRGESRREAEREPRLDVRGFEAMGLSNDRVREYITRGFPREWTSRTSVSSVSYVTHRIPMPEQYGIHGHEAGHCTISPDGSSSEIVVTIDALDRADVFGEQTRDESMSLLRSIIPHELAHAGDWLNAADLDPRARLEILWRVMQRVRSPDRLRFPYVENIRNDNVQREWRDKATEYLAELARAMFEARASADGRKANRWRSVLATNLSRQYGTHDFAAQEDIRIMERLLPDFDWAEASRARGTLLTGLLRDRMRFAMERPLSHVEDSRLRAYLLDAFRMHPEDARPALLLSRFGNEDLGEADAEVKEAYERAMVEALERLKQNAPLEMRSALDAWIILAQNLTYARGLSWFPSSEMSPFSRRLMEKEMGDVDTLNHLMRGMRDDRLRTAFDETARRALRIIAAGEVRLSAEEESRAADWLAEEERAQREGDV